MFWSKPKGLDTGSADIQGQAQMDIPGQPDTEYFVPPFCSMQAVN